MLLRNLPACNLTTGKFNYLRMSTTERSYMQDFSKFSVLFKPYLVENQSKNLPLPMNRKNILCL